MRLFSLEMDNDRARTGGFVCGDWCPPNCMHEKEIMKDIPVLHKLKSETTITKS